MLEELGAEDLGGEVADLRVPGQHRGGEQGAEGDGRKPVWSEGLGLDHGVGAKDRAAPCNDFGNERRSPCGPLRPGPLRRGRRRPALAARRAPGRVDSRRPAAARAPARLHPRAPLQRRRSCRWRPSGTGCRGSRCATPTAAAASPTTGPASWSPTRSSICAPYGDDVHEYVRRLEQVAIRSLAEHGVEAGTIEGLTGVWTEGERPGTAAGALEARKIGSIGVHVSRGITTHGLAINVNNDLQAVRVDRALRDRGLPGHLAEPRARRRAGPRRLRRPRSPTTSPTVYERDAGRDRPGRPGTRQR